MVRLPSIGNVQKPDGSVVLMLPHDDARFHECFVPFSEVCKHRIAWKKRHVCIKVPCIDAFNVSTYPIHEPPGATYTTDDRLVHSVALRFDGRGDVQTCTSVGAIAVDFDCNRPFYFILSNGAHKEYMPIDLAITVTDPRVCVACPERGW